MKSSQFYTQIGALCAVLCILGPLTIPIGVVHVSLANFLIYIMTLVFGIKKTTVCVLLYLLIGAAGLPVFSGFSGGFGRLIGPTGGYLIGYLVIPQMGGIIIKKLGNNKTICVISLIIATLIIYMLGSLWLSYQSGISYHNSLIVGVYPFILIDIFKIILSINLSFIIKKHLVKSRIKL